MTTENSGEAVCGTCGGDWKSGAHFGAYSHPFTPAPVVPSDDRYVQYRRSAVAEMADWHEGFDMTGVSVSEADRANGSPLPGDKIARNPKNHDDRWLVSAAYFADNFEPISAPPTPSQDAEGDGERAMKRVIAGSVIPGPDWHDMLLMMQAHHNGEHDWSAKDPYDCTVCHVGIESFEERAWAIGESAIRAPYEELVKAARRVQAATVFAEHKWGGGGSMRYECSDEDALLALGIALTRIEESLGGRKDA